MYDVKKQVYLYLTKNQKSALCNFLRALVKKSPDLSVGDLLEKFIEDETYYLEINASRFEFLSDIINNKDFLNDTELYINECRKYKKKKKKQEPLLKAQKEFEKKKRIFLREVRMSKEAPTSKQLYYYEKLCRKYNIEKKDLASKLEARDEIDKIISEHDPSIINLPEASD